MCKISIIIPVYNAHNYLERCLDSVCNQTLKGIEIICVDDCSTDDSLSILNRYALQYSNMKIIVHNKNKGESAARNTGIKASRGEYLGFVDNDDAVDLDFYEKLYAKAKQENADIAKAEVQEIDCDGKESNDHLNYMIRKYNAKLYFTYHWWTAIYKNSMIRENEIYLPEGYPLGGDVLFLNKAVLLANKVALVDDTFYHYYRQEESGDSKVLSLDKIKSVLDIHGQILNNTLAVASTQSAEGISRICNWCLESALTYAYRNHTTECLEFCIEKAILFYQCSKNYLQLEKTSILQMAVQYLKAKDKKGLRDFYMRYSSPQKRLFDVLRFSVKNKQENKKRETNDLKISVIVPVYNVQDYLRKCLDSLCRQLYQNLEIICVDDYSTDDSLKILKDFAQKDKRIQVVQHRENKGVAAARQTGVDMATGRYIAFIDSDDWVDEDYYEKMIQKAEQDQTDITINSTIMDCVKDKEVPHPFHGHDALERRIYDNPAKWVDKFLCVAWNKLFKASFLKERSYAIPKRQPHEDVFLHYATFAFAQKVSFFDGPVYHYSYREESISKAKHDRGLEHIKAYSQIYDFYKENDLLNKKIKLYSTMPFFIIKNEEMFNEYSPYNLYFHKYC